MSNSDPSGSRPIGANGSDDTAGCWGPGVCNTAHYTGPEQDQVSQDEGAVTDAGHGLNDQVAKQADEYRGGDAYWQQIANAYCLEVGVCASVQTSLQEELHFEDEAREFWGVEDPAAVEAQTTEGQAYVDAELQLQADEAILAIESSSVTLYHGTTSEDAASIRRSGIDLSQGNPKTDFGRAFYTTRDYGQALARAHGDPRGVLTYRVSVVELSQLSNLTFQSNGVAYDAYLREVRAGGGGTFDYVEGPVLRNISQFYSQGKPSVAFGNQVAFRTPKGVGVLDGSLQ